MKIRIANLLDGAAGTLVVAGSLSVPAAIWAQTSPYSMSDRPSAVSQRADEWRSFRQTARSSHLLETKVELAWLADPVTSPYRLEARMIGSTVEVRGQVPNEAVLGHALRLARAECHMPVVSRVQLNPALRAPASGKSQEVLHRQAFQILRQAFPAQAPSIAISTLADGAIVLKGTVPTYENKLAISRHLRQATTCSCIQNQLQVLAESHENRPSRSRTAAATLLVPAPLKPQLLQAVAYAPPAESVALGSPLPAQHLSAQATGPGGSLANPKARGLGSAKSAAPRFTTNAKPASVHPGFEPPAKPAAIPVVYPTKWRRLNASEIAQPRKVVPVATYKDAAKTPTPRQAAAVSTPRPYLPAIPKPHAEPAPAKRVSNLTALPSGSGASTKTEAPAVAMPSLPHRSRPAPALISNPAIASSRPPSLVTPIAEPSSLSVPPLTANRTGIAKQEPYVTDGVILVESMIKPASFTAPAMGPKPLPIVKTGPYVTSGVILFSDSAREKMQPTTPALAALQARLQERIAAVCGKPSRDVEVTALTETNVAVRVRANSTLEGEEFSNRIFQLPELGPCQVSLDVLVMK